jgi:hypothetical protein
VKLELVVICNDFFIGMDQALTFLADLCAQGVVAIERRDDETVQAFCDYWGKRTGRS